ncbi:alpha/beta hydrolase [Phenylobacterium sp. LjRoot225]|uniref:alpha/beta fold hydrolase n=1 Tax=Phenylobacterium sp. LjRoot225 TaxID=3342285 RepID=UPI003ECE3E76
MEACPTFGDWCSCPRIPTGVLGALRVPALVIGGDKDIVTKLEASRTIAAESELAALHVVEDVNHMGPMERADLYIR